MFKFIAMPVFFFRELIFESKEEYDINSTSFNTKKVLTFFIVIFSICLNIFLLARVIELALSNIELTEANAAMKKKEDVRKATEALTKGDPTGSP